MEPDNLDSIDLLTVDNSVFKPVATAKIFRALNVALEASNGYLQDFLQDKIYKFKSSTFKSLIQDSINTLLDSKSSINEKRDAADNLELMLIILNSQGLVIQ
jgi:hypothetical protein